MQNLCAQLLVMNFNQDSATTIVGPSPNSLSSSAGTLPGGSNGRGLAAQHNGSVPKLDINMDFNNIAGYWDISGIDCSIDFNRKESTGDFFSRLGNDFEFGMTGGNLFVNYEVSNGMGGSTTLGSGTIQAIANDDTWRRYRFTYDPNTGVGTVYVNNVSVWTNDGPDNRPMYWTGAGAFRIGNQMDASGAVEAIFDSIYVASINVLPVELVHFRGQRQEGSVHLNWETASETQNDHFRIERSLNNEQWEQIGVVIGAGNSDKSLNYSYFDQ